MGDVTFHCTGQNKENKSGFFVEKQKQLSISAEKSAKFEEGGKEKKKKRKKRKMSREKIGARSHCHFSQPKVHSSSFYTPFSFLSS